MAAIFNEAMLDRIDADLALALQGDRGARQRVYQKHMKWLLHYARYTNQQVALAMAEYEAEWEETSDELEADADFNKGDPIVSEPDEGPEPGIGFAEEVTDEDSVAEPGSPTALAEAAAIAEAEEENETPENPVEDVTDGSEETPETAEAEESGSEEAPEAESDEETLKSGQILPPDDFVISPKLMEASGGIFFEPGNTPEGGITAPWLIDETDEANSETENE